MKKIIVLALCSIFTFTTSGCNKSKDSDFEIRLTTDRYVYKISDEILISSTIEYIGDKKNLLIWHADPAITFIITDGKALNIGSTVSDILMSTKINKNEKQYYYFKENSNDLQLPIGKYTIISKAEFSLSKNSDSKINLLCELDIVVEE